MYNCPLRRSMPTVQLPQVTTYCSRWQGTLEFLSWAADSLICSGPCLLSTYEDVEAQHGLHTFNSSLCVFQLGLSFLPIPSEPAILSTLTHGPDCHMHPEALVSSAQAEVSNPTHLLTSSLDSSNPDRAKLGRTHYALRRATTSCPPHLTSATPEAQARGLYL